ncbi:MAG TPA: ABC transporter permease [Acetobacteraceae bacterium]|jgi:peptide/nickel transport system permease protein|nr:ABC transporter permease [Acetobacteraceae bacterium]
MHALLHVGRRAGQIAITVLLVALLTFTLLHMLPGDPAVVLLGERATEATIAQLHHQMGLDQPMPVQFWRYLVSLATLNLGDSLTMRIPVATLLIQRLPVTLGLTCYALLLALLIAVPLAFAAALREGGIADTIIQVASQIGLSMPVFYLGLILLITLAAGLGWFPVGGIGDSFLADIRALFLPALTLALSLSALLMRNLRAALVEVLAAEFVSFARAKGLPRRLLLLRHVLRNALVSTLTLLGIRISGLVGGAVITETVFAIPGVGRLMIDSIFARDYAVVQGTILVIAVLVSLVFLTTDALQAMLDPRVEA